MIAKGPFILGGSICILLGLFVTLLVVGMLQQPGGMGFEKLLAPLIGLAALGLFLTAEFVCTRPGLWASGVQANSPEIREGNEVLKVRTFGKTL
jgi:hypothetical protein